MNANPFCPGAPRVRMAEADSDGSIPLSWIVIFLLLALGLAAAGVLFVGGDLVGAGVLSLLIRPGTDAP